MLEHLEQGLRQVTTYELHDLFLLQLIFDLMRLPGAVNVQLGTGINGRLSPEYALKQHLI